MALEKILVLALLAFLAQSTSGLYFHILETSHPKCFIEEIPDETLVVGKDFTLYSDTFWIFLKTAIVCSHLFLKGKYKTQAWDDSTSNFLPSSPGIGMHVVVTDPAKKTLMSKYYSSEGKFSFTSHTPGEHTICLQTNSTKWTSGKKLVSL